MESVLTNGEHYNCHVHCVISGGGLSLDTSSWIFSPKGKKKPRRPFLFPVTALAQVFQGEYIAASSAFANEGNLPLWAPMPPSPIPCPSRH